MVPVDFAPLQDHIFIRLKGIPFYVPEIFHLHPNFHRKTPVLIRDINNSPRPVSIYGPRAIHKQIFFIKNHPVKDVRVVGKIVGEFLKEFGDYTSNYLQITVDDSSGANLMINVFVQQLSYIQGGLDPMNSYGAIVRIHGTVKYFKSSVDIRCFYIERVGDGSDLVPELDHWQECLVVRERFSNPWNYDPPYTSTRPSQPPYAYDGRCDLFDSQTEALFTLTEPEVIVIDDDDEYNDTHDHKNRNGKKVISEDLELVGQTTAATAIVTDFQVTIAIIEYLIQHKFQPVKLADIYRNPQINSLVDDLTVSKIPVDANDFLTIKHQIFHDIRHMIQKDLNLITTTKLQVVKLHKLLLVYDNIYRWVKLVKESQSPKKLQLDYFLRILRSQIKELGLSFDTRYLNGMIEIVIEKERHLWSYDRKRKEWYLR